VSQPGISKTIQIKTFCHSKAQQMNLRQLSASVQFPHDFPSIQRLITSKPFPPFTNPNQSPTQPFSLKLQSSLKAHSPQHFNSFSKYASPFRRCDLFYFFSLCALIIQQSPMTISPFLMIFIFIFLFLVLLMKNSNCLLTL
jgi:hypothetical protein